MSSGPLDPRDEGRRGFPDLDPGLRETAESSAQRWRRRLETPGFSDVDVGFVAQEAAQLRGLALARGSNSLAEYLQAVVSAANGPPGAIAGVVNRLAQALASSRGPGRDLVGSIVIDARAAAAMTSGSNAPFGGRGSAPPASLQQPPLLSASIIAAPGAAPAIAPAQPPMVQPSVIVPSVARPPPIDVGSGPPPLSVGQPSAAFAPAPAPLPMMAKAGARSPAAHPGTMLSAEVPALSAALRGESPGPVEPSVRMAPAIERPPAIVDRAAPPVDRIAPSMQGPPILSGPIPQRPNVSMPSGPAGRLPDSIVQQHQPSLIQGGVLHLNAFGKRGPEPEPNARPPGPNARLPGPESKGVLGLESRRARHAPIAAPATDFPARGPAAVMDTRPRRDRKTRPDQRARVSAAPTWFYLVGGGLALLAVVTVTVIVMSSGSRKQEPPQARAESSTSRPSTHLADASPGTMPTPESSGPEMTTKVNVHERGPETPELRALLDTQGRLAARCKVDPSSCGRGWTPLALDALSPIDRSSLVAPSKSGPLPAWLQRLKMPRDFPVRDDPTLHSFFDFNTKNISGRQRLQAKLFDCAAYADIFDSTLVKYGAPTWLTAVVFQESGCNPRATSDVGAKGLWQFMPESARAYGLRVVDDDIDERLNPIKATDAAIHFLTDLERKLGAWDLALAAYNAGPYAILARLAQAGPDVGFWELAHAGLLPEETAGYVPAIEAYALILENVTRLEFTKDGKRLEATAELIVKPGMRLSLVARAASTTTLHIRELNPEFLRDVVPEGETAARVPDAEAHRAQAFLDSWSPDDDRDTCVPEDFDWGAKQFESSKFAKSCAHGAHAP